MAPNNYIDKIIDRYKNMFNKIPKIICISPLEKRDHPELDASNFLDAFVIHN